jgi:rhodanese-related sulfurtransferase
MLRSRLGELPRNKDIIIISSLSIRAYEAALILQSAGFTRVQVVDGGLVAWPFEKILGMK